MYKLEEERGRERRHLEKVSSGGERGKPKKKNNTAWKTGEWKGNEQLIDS